MRYLTVKNWGEFQHYKDRNPPWIKLHRALLDDYEFSRLQDASKAHLMLIWLFASQRDGKVPNDPAFLKEKLGLQKEPNLQLFIDQGLLIPEQVASNTLADSKQSAPLEEERGGEAYTTPQQQQSARATRLPLDWQPSEILKAWAEKERPDLDLNVVVQMFKNHWAAKPGKDGYKLDWEATFRNWVLKEKPGTRRATPNLDKVIAEIEEEDRRRATH